MISGDKVDSDVLGLLKNHINNVAFLHPNILGQKFIEVKQHSW